MWFKTMQKRVRAAMKLSDDEDTVSPDTAGPFRKLPREILQHIASLLEPECVVGLMFTCKYINQVIDGRNWYNFPCHFRRWFPSKDSRRRCAWSPYTYCGSQRAALKLIGRDFDPSKSIVCPQHSKIHLDRRGWRRVLLRKRKCRSSAESPFVVEVDIPLNDIQAMVEGYKDVESCRSFRTLRRHCLFAYSGENDTAARNRALRGTLIGNQYAGSRNQVLPNGDLTFYARIINGQFFLAMQACFHIKKEWYTGDNIILERIIRREFPGNFDGAYDKHMKLIYHPKDPMETYGPPSCYDESRKSNVKPARHGFQHAPISWNNFRFDLRAIHYFLGARCTREFRTVEIMRTECDGAFIKINIFADLGEGCESRRLMDGPGKNGVAGSKRWICSDRCAGRCAQQRQLGKLVKEHFVDHEERLERVRVECRERQFNVPCKWCQSS